MSVKGEEARDVGNTVSNSVLTERTTVILSVGTSFALGVLAGHYGMTKRKFGDWLLRKAMLPMLRELDERGELRDIATMLESLPEPAPGETRTETQEDGSD